MNDYRANALEQVSQASTASQNTRRSIDAETKLADELNQLILAVPAQAPLRVEPAQNDTEIQTDDSFERQPPPAPPAPLVKPPVVGPPAPPAAEDTVLPTNGRTAAVILQEHLAELRRQGDSAQFAKIARDLGVNPNEVDAFGDLVDEGDAIETFKAIDHSRVSFIDSNENEVDVDQLSAVAKTQLVIRPAAEVPVDPDIHNPEVAILNPYLQEQRKLNNPDEKFLRDAIDPNRQPRPVVDTGAQVQA